MTPLQRIAIAACGTLLATAAHADPVSAAGHCEVRGPGDPHADAHAAAVLRQHPSNLVEICMSANRPAAYNLLTTPAHAGPDLCRYTRRPVEGGGPQESFDSVTPGPCPPAGDEVYFSVQKVPDDLLPRLVAFLRAMAASDAGFDDAAASLDAAKSPQASRQFARFRHAVRSGATRLLSVERAGPGDEPRGGFFLTFADASSASTRWRLAIVPVGGRLLARRIDEGVVQ